MLFNFKLDDLIPLLTIGAVLITAIYHTILYFFNRIKLVGSYTTYLWLALCYLILAVSTVPTKTFKSPSIYYLISSGVFWASLLVYLNFLLIVLNYPKEKETIFYTIIKKTYLITPIYFLLRFPYFFFPTQYVETIKACGFIMDAYFFIIFGYVVYLIIYTKRRNYNSYVVIGSVLMMFFNLFTSITYYTQGYIFGLSHVSFIALGYFSDILFFSLVVALKMRKNIKEKYVAINEMSKKELALEIERKKASDILLTQDFKLENERTKTIIEQRTIIGRKLHDDLSGSLVALKFLVQDFKIKATNDKEKEKFTDLEAEISNIYNQARDYSHELSQNTMVAASKISYNVAAYLKKISEQFLSLDLLAIHIKLNEHEINKNLNITQTKHIYFLLKECISNTIKHSVAKNIWIDIAFNNHTCNIHFSDDGGGLNDTINEGMGINGMRESVEYLNGTLDLTNTPAGISIIVAFKIA